ncbi:MAG: hypothetical protein GTN40_03340 [Candidatus Aenigmarchaeota archaeon]|nr:hypothetical protein [Candidatus Aenigmarchaeota archaeon]
MDRTEEILNKLAYADGKKKVDDTGVRVYDNGMRYTFGLGETAYALGVPNNENPVLGVASRVLSFGIKKENEYKSIIV